ncbi:MAG: sigma-70 family RNA polymerase sigma factor [bacterium]
MVNEQLEPRNHDADYDLAQAVGRGDPRASRELAGRLLNRVRTTIHYLATGDRDADDLVQLSLVAILRSAGTYRGECSLERWGDRIAVRTALRHLKRRRWRERIVALEAEPPEGAVHQEQAIQRRLLRERLGRLLAKLSPDRRVAVTLHWVHGYSVQEIAELTDAKLNTVRDRLRIAKKQLKDWLLKDPALRDWARSFIDETHG